MSSGTIPNLETYIKSGFNILVSGLHGTGKTQSIDAACAELGLKVKYYSASTLDPYTDLVGVPVPRTDDDGVETLKMVRPREIDSAEVVIFDELNRAEAKTRNAVMELVQFRSINGEKLPNLKCVVAAINPPDGDYDVEELDPALVDRFHVTIDVTPRVSNAYFRNIFGDRTASALTSWWNDINKAKRASYLSPRRLELIGHVWKATHSVEALKAAMPPGGVFEVSKLATMLREAEMTSEELERIAQARAAAEKAAVDAEAARVASLGSWTAKELRDVSKVETVASALKQSPTDLNLHTRVMDAFKSGVGTSKLFSSHEYLPVMVQVHESALSSAFNSWNASKRSQARNAFHSHLLRFNYRKVSAKTFRDLYGSIDRAFNTNYVEHFVTSKRLK